MVETKGKIFCKSDTYSYIHRQSRVDGEIQMEKLTQTEKDTLDIEVTYKINT